MKKCQLEENDNIYLLLKTPKKAMQLWIYSHIYYLNGVIRQNECGLYIKKFFNSSMENQPELLDSTTLIRS